MPKNFNISHLVRLFGNECHYCGETCNRKAGSPRQATVEHIVPRYFGGRNHVSNYVLACADCNVERGTRLFFCECSYICGPKIAAALDAQANFDLVFSGLLDFNKPKVYKAGDRWVAKFGHSRIPFSSFDEAVASAMKGHIIKRPKDANEVNNSTRDFG